jgi:RNA polymerase sigma-70 factor, ECF subfamily
MGGAATGCDATDPELDALYRAHFPRLVRFCRLLLDDPMEAQDVAQEVFIRLMRTPPASDRAIAWRPWLTRVALNLCRDRRRSWWWSWSRRQREDLADVTITAPEPTPEHAAAGAELGGKIWDAFRRLPRRQREVFALRHFEEWSTDDVAEALRVSPGSVKRHLFRAIRQLRTALGEYR